MKEASERELFEFLRDIDARLDGEKLKAKVALYIFRGADVLPGNWANLNWEGSVL